MNEPFDIIGPIRDMETIAVGKSLQARERLIQDLGPGRWRKMKGFATIRYIGGRICEAELHWYEAHGRGRFEIKVKRELS